MKVKNGVLIKVKEKDLDLLKEKPDEFWKGVTKIGEQAFRKLDNLTEITIPQNVKEIGISAFGSCVGLKKVRLDGVEYIHERAFEGCDNLEEINFPDSLIQIMDTAFFSCRKLEKAMLNDGLLAVGTRAFWYCTSLEEVVIPESLTSFGFSVFEGCTDLKKMTFKNKNNGRFLESIVGGFNFNSFEINGDEVTFIRNIEEEKEVE